MRPRTAVVLAFGLSSSLGCPANSPDILGNAGSSGDLPGATTGSPTGTAGGTAVTTGASVTAGGSTGIPGTGGPGTSGPQPGSTSVATGSATGTGTTGSDSTPGIDVFAENSGADCAVAPGQTARNENLPDPFTTHDGLQVTTMEQWRCRRNEIKRDLEEFEIGIKPEPPQVEASLNGGTLSVVVSTDAGSLTLNSNVNVPNGEGPHCVAIGMNGNASLINGCVQVPFMHDQVVGYRGGTGQQTLSDPFYGLYPELAGQVGNYAAWSWGISRIIDGLEQVQDELDIDVNRIGVQGCSYAGKMALFGGALDERVALTIAQESGGGGINSWRTSQDFTSRTGTNIEKIDNTNYAWFRGNMQGRDPYSLPHDHHELIAMIAPRAVISLGNPPFEWLGDESGYKSVMAAREVWVAMGIEDRFGFDFAGGHDHCSAAASQVTSTTAFVDKFLKGEDTNTDILLQPQAGNFDLDYEAEIDWPTPTIQ